ncbi:MAG: hypothetical protein GXN94_04575 [Aquificae bacterium]|nr:hypothetical protein [Aquificota bacterium]
MYGRLWQAYTLFFLLFIGFLHTSCGEKKISVKLLPEAKKVKVYEATDPAKEFAFKLAKEEGCRILKEEVIIPPSLKEGLYELVDKEIEIMARNKAVEIGGNTVVLETFKEIPGIQFPNRYTGRAIILDCP